MENFEKPKGFAKNVENIWYHYKYVILIALAALIMIGVATFQMVTRKDPDVFIYHASTRGLSLASQDSFLGAMRSVASDYNGDGEVVVDFKEDIYIPNEVKTSENAMTATESFNHELAYGECLIYIMDRSFFNGNKQFMADLSDVLDEVPEYAIDGRGILLKDLPGYNKLAGLGDFEDESYLCLRAKKRGMNEDYYAQHEDFFKKLVEYTGN